MYQKITRSLRSLLELIQVFVLKLNKMSTIVAGDELVDGERGDLAAAEAAKAEVECPATN